MSAKIFSEATELEDSGRFLLLSVCSSSSCETSSPILPDPSPAVPFGSGSESNPVGAWQIIKGKVSQTIEDIKASKGNSNSSSSQALKESLESDTNCDIAAICCTPGDDELSLEQEWTSVTTKKGDCEADVESDLLVLPATAAVDKDRSHSIRRGFNSIKSKVTAKSSPQQQQPQHSIHSQPLAQSSPKISSTTAAAGSAKNMDKNIKPATNSNNVGVTLRRRQRRASEAQEIESGVEMREDMAVPSAPDVMPNTTAFTVEKERTSLDVKGVEASTALQASPGETQAADGNHSFVSRIVSEFHRTAHNVPYYSIVGLVLVMLLPMSGFLRGVLATLLTSSLLGPSWKLFLDLVINASPERSEFQIPSFRDGSVFEIPAAEEHTTVKTYAGWMNEINSYDPNNYHVSMTNSVYIKLDGTVLRVSNTDVRIPKRVLWNEKPIDPLTIPFTQHRTYNLLGCRVEMLPIGLAHKRYFNRKYPIQLIIKQPYAVKSVEPENPRLLEPNAENADMFFDVRGSEASLTGWDNANERSSVSRLENNLDFGATIMNADLRSLRNSDAGPQDISIPRGEEARLLLFSRGAREKEDWYRRFVAASRGDVYDPELKLPNMQFVDDINMQAALYANNEQPTTSANVSTAPSEEGPSKEFKAGRSDDATGEQPDTNVPEEVFEGLVFNSTAARNPISYIRFMALYQKACNQTTIPVYRQPATLKKPSKRYLRRPNRREDELWKGIDQSLFLGPSGSIVWLNVIVGRFIYSFLHDAKMQIRLHQFIQKKISAIKLPGFMEDVTVTQINPGTTPPLIHRASQAVLDERGIWIDADVTYEGLVGFTVCGKLNVMSLKKRAGRPETNPQASTPLDAPSIPTIPQLPPGINLNSLADDIASVLSSFSMQDFPLTKRLSAGVIYDSDAESMGSSSSEGEDPDFDTVPSSNPASSAAPASSATAADTRSSEPSAARLPPPPPPAQVPYRTNSAKIMKIVDRFAASNFFQYATELPYVQRAIENMNANITLTLEVKGMVGRMSVNMPPPPSDRIWIGFRGPPRLWIQAKPAFGDKLVDWTFLTSVIESKICEQINKIMVYPNMVDITLNVLGQPTYQERDY